MSGTLRQPRRQGRFLRDRGSRNLRRRRSAAAGRLTAGQRIVADRRHLLGGQRDAIDAHVTQPAMKRRRSVLLRAADEQPARWRGRSWRDDIRRLRRPSRHPHMSSARGWPDRARRRRAPTGSRRAAWRSLPAHRAAGDDRRAETARLATGEHPIRGVCAEIEDRARMPRSAGTTSHVTLIVSSPDSAAAGSCRWLPSPVSSRTLRNCGSSTNVPRCRAASHGSCFCDESSGFALST